MVICKWNFVRSGCYVTVPIYIKQRFSKTEWVCIPETSRLDTIGSGETVTWPIYPLGEMVVGLLKSSIMVRIYS